MSIVKPKTIEELIVQNLVSGEKKTTALLKEIDPDVRFTKQGFYQALRKLRKEEVVVVYKSIVALNTSWLKQMEAWVAHAQGTYQSADSPLEILNLQEKESVSYSFANTKHLDTFWGHTQNLLVEQTPASQAVFSYDPHYWFYIAREETEKALVDAIVKQGKQFLMTAGGASYLDKYIQKEFSDDNRQYHLEALFDKRNYYVVVIGDYLTEVFLDETVAKEIDALYEKTTALTAETVENMQTLLATKARHRIKISRNKRKANDMRAKLSKNFFVRKLQ